MKRHSKPFRSARTCYDHLAGRLGVDVARALRRRGVLERSGGELVLTATGRRWLEGWGIDVAAIERGSRRLVRSCRDLTERQDHVAGALGAAIAARLLDLGWVERQAGGRVLRVTAAGREGLRRELGIDGPGPGAEPIGACA